MKWCCQRFEGWFLEHGVRGLRVRALRDGKETRFQVAHESLDPGDPGPQDHPRPITISSELDIDFCPWCGVRLRDVYRGADSLPATRSPE